MVLYKLFSFCTIIFFFARCTCIAQVPFAMPTLEFSGPSQPAISMVQVAMPQREYSICMKRIIYVVFSECRMFSS